MKNKVFVYGTLKKGNGNWSHFLRDSHYEGSFVTEDKMLMADNGGFPYAVTQEMADAYIQDPEFLPIRGDLFFVDDATLTRLDGLEGVPYHYTREVTKLEGFDEEVFMYHLASPSSLAWCHYAQINTKGEYEW